MSSLPVAVHTADQVRALDRHAIDDLLIPSYTLMTRAGEATLGVLRSCWPSAQRIAIVCGPGNNGGDGYVLARLAREQRLDVVAVALHEASRLQGDARRAHDDFIAAGGAVISWHAGCLRGVDVIVDAIFGVGLSREIAGVATEAIAAINDSDKAVLAVDIPSGLHADTGEVLGCAVRATRTITFIGLKLGFYLGEGPNCIGVVMFDALELPPQALAHVPAAATRIIEAAIAELLPPRRRTAHKGQQGSVLVIGGNIGMAGAARMTGEAALRTGAGLVTVATRKENVPAIIGARPELMCRGVDSAQELAELIARADVIALGPGLGQDEWAQTMFQTALGNDRRAVVDADALNLLSQAPRTNSHWILTPHPGEAARLLGKTAGEVQRDRLGAARAIVHRYGGTVVLKGAGTLVVTDEAQPAICDRGNPGMASPGMGDVLTGVIAGVVAQSADLAAAARVGVLVHALAGDMAARRGERGLLATDLFAHLPTCVNPPQRS
ncbi:MAG TPA: NAD(P)H-hydrate dehydratase [Steroidobacteraceae bacterium]|jgi:NAD(P)H-hydrate epimerase